MNLLLLLSALLSALTGVTGSGPRLAAPAEQVSVAGLTVTAVQAISPLAPVTQVQTVDARAARLSDAPLVRLTIVELPRYASRRRE